MYVDKTSFIIYMVGTTISIISLGIMCIKNVRRDIELLDLIQKTNETHYKIEKVIIDLIGDEYNDTKRKGNNN